MDSLHVISLHTLQLYMNRNITNFVTYYTHNTHLPDIHLPRHPPDTSPKTSTRHQSISILSSQPVPVNHIIVMCHGHPRYHSCAHTSMKWHYCPSASIDLETGYQTPCHNVSFAPSQGSSASCPLQTCHFKEKGGRWMCCQCKQGPNTQGWCTSTQTMLGGDCASYVTCDHGCCNKCIRLGKSHERMRLN